MSEGDGEGRLKRKEDEVAMVSGGAAWKVPTRTPGSSHGIFLLSDYTPESLWHHPIAYLPENAQIDSVLNVVLTNPWPEQLNRPSMAQATEEVDDR